MDGESSSNAEFKALELPNARSVEDALNVEAQRGWLPHTYQVSGEGMNTRHYLLLQRWTREFLEKVNYAIAGLREGTFQEGSQLKADAEMIVRNATGKNFHELGDVRVTHVP